MDQNGTPRQIVFESTEEGKHSKHLNQSLTITELSVEDRGKYLCSVQTPFEKMNFTIELFVHGEPPKILSNFKQVISESNYKMSHVTFRFSGDTL